MKEKFNPEYLTVREGDAEHVREIPSSRYLPLRPNKISERDIQLLWKNLMFDNSSLKTTNGIPLRILKPGRFNVREGPDFRNAVMELDGKKIAGDVEIHLNAREWYEHKHHLSSHYNRTALHVFLKRSEASLPAATRKGNILHEVELGLFLRHPLEKIQVELEAGGSPVSGRADSPPCRKAIGKASGESVLRMLDIVGEGRMLLKSNRFIDRVEQFSKSQVLYSAIFECLGYSNFKEQFRKMAEKLPYSKLQEVVGKNPGIHPHIAVQAAFFKLSGLDKTAQLTGTDAAMKELMAQYAKVDSSEIKPIFSIDDWPLTGCRPINYPQRRIAAFSHIVCKPDKFEWIGAGISSLIANEGQKFARRDMEAFLESFTGVTDSFWDFRYNFNKPIKSRKRLIGKDRALSIFVDCLIPYFLALSRTEYDIEMEKRLLGLYYSLPKPSSNAVIDFMVRNMLGKETSVAVKTVRRQQALLQLYSDFCYKFPSSCRACPLPEYIGRFE